MCDDTVYTSVVNVEQLNVQKALCSTHKHASFLSLRGSLRFFIVIVQKHTIKLMVLLYSYLFFLIYFKNDFMSFYGLCDYVTSVNYFFLIWKC